MAQVVKIYLRPSSRTPVREVSAAQAVAGKGLEGDHAGGGSRQVTLIEREEWEAACSDLGRDLEPAGRRANLVIEGMRLAAAVGRRLHIGECTVRIVGETRPCKLMDDFAQGLKDALSPSFRGGVYGQILTGGVIEVGSRVALLPAETAVEHAGI